MTIVLQYMGDPELEGTQKQVATDRRKSLLIRSHFQGE